jgi:hypothetical protein
LRTTLSIEDDVLAAAKELAATQRKTVGEVISQLARKALQPPTTVKATRNGVPLLRAGSGGGQRVTSELVQRLREELP